MPNPAFSKLGKVFTGGDEASNWLNGWFDPIVLSNSIVYSPQKKLVFLSTFSHNRGG